MPTNSIRLAASTDETNPLSINIHDLNASPTPPPILPEGEEWSDRRRVIDTVWRDRIGRLDEPGSGEITVRNKTNDPDESFERWLVHLDGGAIGAIPAEILVPDGVVDAGTATRAVVACHTTNADGKYAVTTRIGNRRHPYGVELAERGYVVIAPDCVSAGERIFDGRDAYNTEEFYREHPDSSMVARNITDHMTAISALISLPFVDPDRIGTIGHSLGGYTSYFLAGMDDRVKAVVNSCGFSPLRHTPKATHWGHRDWYTHLPRLNEDFARFRVPFDFGQIAALMAPIPMFNYFGQVDQVFPQWESIAEALQALRQLYIHLGHEERFTMIMTGGPHAFPADIRGLAYAFLDRWLAADD